MFGWSIEIDMAARTPWAAVVGLPTLAIAARSR
jgi:hypothetical protein